MPNQPAQPPSKPVGQAADKHYHFFDSVDRIVRSNMTSTTQCVSTMTFSGRSLSVRSSELGVFFSDTDPDLVLAPSDFWKVKFHPRLDNYLKDEDKFPGDKYTYEETIIEVSVKRSRRRSLTKRYKKLEVD